MMIALLHLAYVTAVGVRNYTVDDVIVNFIPCKLAYIVTAPSFPNFFDLLPKIAPDVGRYSLPPSPQSCTNNNIFHRNAHLFRLHGCNYNRTNDKLLSLVLMLQLSLINATVGSVFSCQFMFSEICCGYNTNRKKQTITQIKKPHYTIWVINPPPRLGTNVMAGQ